ncbi:GNAT family N-acetyltransferase [Synechococcus sp. CS-1325]|nr:GNAT family N-acetyltransferase [Synechococcus sp. CS-1325]MCT0199569.1 GNAT family N-acetyltransferase [Synechococcus sp. CS-1325]PZV02781.1 MAG: GNAT family N-acetyltransferase [Cyanobium sp.]
MSGYSIRPMRPADLPQVTEWARREGFCPGPCDVDDYRDTDSDGLWVGCLNGEPVGCIAGVRYDDQYGFIGLFLVRPEHRGHGYGVALWERALAHLEGVACVGLEAADARLVDYSGWGFTAAGATLRWRRDTGGRGDRDAAAPDPQGITLLPAAAVPKDVVQDYDARHEATPRPLFLGLWLGEPNPGTVVVALDAEGCCRGYGRIRPCLLDGPERAGGWRLGPLIADSSPIAQALIDQLTAHRHGPVLIDAPEANPRSGPLLRSAGFSVVSHTVRMYRGGPPQLPLQDLYGLACLELG